MLIDSSSDTTIPVLFTDPSTGASVNADSLPTFRTFGTDVARVSQARVPMSRGAYIGRRQGT